MEGRPGGVRDQQQRRPDCWQTQVNSQQPTFSNQQRSEMIRVENLVKRFGELTAVDNISFTVERGEIFAFLGPNGAGKTTTIKMLTTLLKPTSGSLELDGLDPTVHRDEVRKRFGV